MALETILGKDSTNKSSVIEPSSTLNKLKALFKEYLFRVTCADNSKVKISAV